MPLPLLIALYILLPAVVISLCMRFRTVDKVGAVVICYVAGVALGNVGLLPDGADEVQEPMTEVAVALSLPLLLFSMDLRRWVRVAGKALLSMLLAVVAVVVVATVAYLLVLPEVPEGWQVAGMAVGVYTGGTPNVAAIKAALDVDSTLFVVVHTYDTLLGAAYILFCVTFARRVFGLLLRPFRSAEPEGDGAAGGEVEAEETSSYRGILAPRALLGLLLAVLLSSAIVGASLLLASLVSEDYRMAVLILAITTLSLASSFAGPVRRIPKTFQLGMYVIYVFCFVVGSMASIETMASIDPAILAYITICVFGTMTVHALLCRLLRVDVDTFIITSVAAVCSPPFVPVVAGALRNRIIVLSGLTTGIIGYAVGNYLGIAVALALRGLGN